MRLLAFPFTIVFVWTGHKRIFILYAQDHFIEITKRDIGGLQPISRDTDNNAAMHNCWWTNKRS